MKAKDREYVLGTDTEELLRLKLQHDLWVDEAVKLWKKAHFDKAQKLMDLGCGPGFTSLALADVMPAGGEITSLDMSDKFLQYLQDQATKQTKIKIRTLLSPIEELSLPLQSFDGAYCRWLMIFVKDPEAAIRKIAEPLKTGAVFALQEYVTYDSMALAPDSEIMNKVVQAIFQSWRDQGGDPNRGRILPQLLEKNGFTVTEIEPIARFARPNDPLWKWPDSFYKSFLPRLVAGNYISEAQSKEFFAEWDHSKQVPGRFFIAPTMMNIIARKK